MTGSNCREILASTRISIVPQIEMLSKSMTPEQLITVFSLVAESGSGSFRELGVSSNDYSIVPTDLLVAALTKLEKVVMVQCNLSAGQLQALFREIAAADGSSIVQHLDVSFNPQVGQVPSDLLVAAVSRLESVRLYNCFLGADQLTAVYRMVAESRSGRLKEIDCNGNNLSEVSQSLRSRAKLNEDVRI